MLRGLIGDVCGAVGALRRRVPNPELPCQERLPSRVASALRLGSLALHPHNVLLSCSLSNLAHCSCLPSGSPAPSHLAPASFLDG